MHRMRKIIFSLAFILGSLLTFNNAYSSSSSAKSSIKPIKTILILVPPSLPSFISSGEINKEVSFQNKNPESLASSYSDKLWSVLSSDIAKIMWKNGIDSHFSISGHGEPAGTPPDLKRYLGNEVKNWKYALWIRHLRGKIDCSKKPYYLNGCEALYHTRATIFDTANGKIMWDVDRLGNDYFDYRVWEDGRMYTYLLTRLKNDGWIELPKAEPVVK